MQDFCGLRRQFDQGGHHFVHEFGRSRSQELSEITDAAESGRKLDLDSMGRRKVDGILGMKPEPDALVSHLVTLKALLEQLSCRLEKLRIQPSQDDPPQRPRLASPDRWPVRFDEESRVGIDPESESIAPESMHRDGDVDVLQEDLQLPRVSGIVQARGQVHPQLRWMLYGVVGRSCVLGGPAGNPFSAPVL